METIELQRRWGLGLEELERLRESLGGMFGIRRVRRVRVDGKKFSIEPLEDWEHVHNIVTNEGINAALNIMLHGSTQITTWYGALSKTNTTPLATHTYASPGFTEVATSDINESVRQDWVEAAASSQSITNAASPIVYTGKITFTAYGMGLVGGGSNPTVLANTAGGGTLWSSALFSSSKAMALNVQLQITYAFSGADDGV